jgi:S-adenosylmethionine:tRNA ribosyltransferase-isomerase
MRYSLKDFDIQIPERLIAQYPSEKRGKSRLFVLNRTERTFVDDQFENLKDYLSSHDCVVYNDARVIHARLYGEKKESGGRVEILLTRKLRGSDWLCLIRPARRIRKGTQIGILKKISLTVLEVLEGGLFRATFSSPLSYESLKQIGEIPLPKYIRRKPEKQIDNHRYQTVFSRSYGAVASPTAGLHFTSEMIRGIREKGVLLVPVTLYVEWGSFQPVREDDYRNHKIHSELYNISKKSAEHINRSITQKRRIICVGTTSVRAIESSVDESGKIKSGKRETDLYIYPGYRFRTVEGMITNFHMPDSTLILLVAAFAGKQLIEEAYKYAVSKSYRFFSYGDAMLIV